MVVSARTLRSLTFTRRHTREECVQRCEACAESTPHVRVVRARLLLVVLALALGAVSVEIESWIAAGAGFAAFLVWVFLRRRDHARPLQCVRCLDRPLRKGGVYLIDFM
ncbi:MAG TPA: hypothetical protein VK843_12340 [Planctomycetota bacterium]|nr:hypothetical protein [Planctomycetota bacterium]